MKVINPDRYIQELLKRKESEKNITSFGEGVCFGIDYAIARFKENIEPITLKKLIKILR